MQVKKDGEEIRLTKKEYDLLLLFVQNPGRALYRDTIYEQVWGGEYQVREQNRRSSCPAPPQESRLGEHP